MKKSQIIYSIFFVAVFLLFGCNSEEEQAKNLEVLYSSVVKSSMVDDQVVYIVDRKLTVYAHLTEVYEISPEGTFDLSGDIKLKNGVSEIHRITKYYNEEPPGGTCFFNIHCADGRQKTVACSNLRPFLTPAQNISVRMDDQGFIILKWDMINNSTWYQIITQVNGSEKVIHEPIIDCKATFHCTDFGLVGPVDVYFEIRAVSFLDWDIITDTLIINSESTAGINYCIAEFIPL